MHISQIALSVINNRETEKARALALAGFLLHGDRTRAAHQLLPVIIAEMKRPIYDGVDISGDAATAAAHCLEMEICRAADVLCNGGAL
jgi:hypothetical protein